MKIAYFMNTYPSTSQTFIRGEIRQLEAAGVEITRVAIRRSADPLVTEADREEAAATRYLLDDKPGLIAAFAREAMTNPLGLARAIGTWARLLANAGGNVVAHVAYLLEAVRLKQIARAAGAAHLHTHFSTNSAAVAMLAARCGGPAYSFTAHGPNEFYDRTMASIALKVRHARFVAAITSHAKTLVLEPAGMAAWDKIHVVRCGVDLDAFRPEGPPAPGAPLVCVGRLCLEKGQALIPAAVAALAGRHPGLSVDLIGDGDARPAIEAAIARHGVADRVRLLGWRSHAEVRDRIAACRSLLLPSFAEGLPIVLMEALALERPVITTWITGHPELVTHDCGWLFAPGDPHALEDALDHAMQADAQTLATMGRMGREIVRARHDQRANALQLKAIFEKVTAGGA